MWVRESYVNETKGYRFGDSVWYEAHQTTLGQLFRGCQKKYGRCVSKMYRDPDATQVGWVFEGRQRYEDAPTHCRDCGRDYSDRPDWSGHWCQVTGRRVKADDITYVRAVWLEVSDTEPERVPTHWVGAHSPWAA